MTDSRQDRTADIGPPRAEDIAAVWFLELEVAERDGNREAVCAALDELRRLGWDVRRRLMAAGGDE